jgi:hypothetical protein
MSITFPCPVCSANIKAPDTAAGKHSLCPRCGAILSVPGIASRLLPPADGSTLRPVEEPARKRPAPSARSPFTLDDFDDDPTSTPAAALDDYDRPRSRKHKPETSNKGLLIGLSFGGAVLVGGLAVVFIVMLASGKESDTSRQQMEDLARQNKELIAKLKKAEGEASAKQSKVDARAKENKVQRDAEDQAARKRAEHPAAAVVRRYLSADTWEARLPFVVNRDKVRPLMEQHYRGVPFRKLAKIEVGPVEKMSSSGREWFLVTATAMVDGHRTSPSRFTVRQSIAGPLVDWEASIGYNAMSLRQFLTVLD